MNFQGEYAKAYSKFRLAAINKSNNAAVEWAKSATLTMATLFACKQEVEIWTTGDQPLLSGKNIGLSFETPLGDDDGSSDLTIEQMMHVRKVMAQGILPAIDAHCVLSK